MFGDAVAELYGLAKYIRDVVVVRRELLHGCPLVEGEEIDLVVHPSKGVRALA